MSHFSDACCGRTPLLQRALNQIASARLCDHVSEKKTVSARVDSTQTLRCWWWRGRCNAVALHKVHELRAVWRTGCSFGVDCCGLTEELRFQKSWSNRAEAPRVYRSVVVLAVGSTAKNAKRLPGA